jgi:DNA-directed RNA polymerase specialized sigma24 family protein
VRESPDSDAADALARRFQAGDAAALAPLYRAVEPVLRAGIARACRRLSSAVQPADLRQQSWVILADLAVRWQPRPGIAFAAYAGRAFPWALGRYVRANAAVRHASACHVFIQSHDEVITALERTPGPDGRDWDDLLYCRELLHELEPRARLVLWLHAVEARSFTDVAQALGLPRATVYDLYRRALRAARRAA